MQGKERASYGERERTSEAPGPTSTTRAVVTAGSSAVEIRREEGRVARVRIVTDALRIYGLPCDLFARARHVPTAYPLSVAREQGAADPGGTPRTYTLPCPPGPGIHGARWQRHQDHAADEPHERVRASAR